MRRGLPTVLAALLAGLPAGAAEAGQLVRKPAAGQAPLAAPATASLDRIKGRKTTADAQAVELDLPVLDDVREPVVFEVAPGKSLTVAFASADRHAAKDFTWRGRILGGKGGDATLVVKGDKVSGMIRHGTEIYAVEPLGGGHHAVIRIDPSKFPADHPPAPTGQALQDKPAAGKTQTDTGGTGTSTKLTVVNVLVAYTPNAKAARDDMDGMIALAVDEANQSYLNSRIPLALNLVRAYQTQYAESGSFETDLTRFRSPGDGFMDEVQAERAASAADVAVLIIDNAGYCGLASGIMANADTAYAAVHYDCATGYFSFAHEIGHLQGARHDPAADPSVGPVCADYNHGYVNTAKGWRTIMAYNDGACPNGFCTRIQYWSNPRVKYDNDATGNAGANNALCLSNTRATVSAFR